MRLRRSLYCSSLLAVFMLLAFLCYNYVRFAWCCPNDAELLPCFPFPHDSGNVLLKFRVTHFAFLNACWAIFLICLSLHVGLVVPPSLLNQYSIRSNASLSICSFDSFNFMLSSITASQYLKSCGLLHTYQFGERQSALLLLAYSAGRLNLQSPCV